MDLRKFQEAEGGVNHVLRVVVENMSYPTTLEVLTHLFGQFGNVLKVITFTKNSKCASPGLSILYKERLFLSLSSRPRQVSLDRLFT